MNLNDVPKATYDAKLEAIAVAHFKSYFDRGIRNNIPAAPVKLIHQVRGLRKLNAMGY